MNPSRSAFGNTSTYEAFPQDQDDDLSSNPFADLASSSVAYPSTTQQSSFYDQPSSPDQSTAPVPATPVQDTASFHREDAPEPETPVPPTSSFAYSSYDNDPFTPSSPLASTVDVPLSPSEQTPFGSPPTSPPKSAFQEAVASPPLPSSTFSSEPISHYRQSSKADMSALLGEEKPTLPSFSKPKRKDRSEGVAGPLGSKIAVLPVSSVGRKPVGGALAALLGLEVEEEEKKEEKKDEKREEVVSEEQKGSEAKEAKKDVTETQASPQDESLQVKSEGKEEEEEEAIPEAPLPPSEPTNTDSLTPAAFETPLPPSPTETTTPPTASTSIVDSELPTPTLSRMPSEAPSTFSTRSSANENISYDSMVSPLETSTDEHGKAAWPANKSIEGLESKLASVVISQPENASPSSDSTPTASFSSPSTSQPPDAESTPGSSLPTTSAEPSYSQYIFSDNSTTSEPQPASIQTPFETPSKGFRAFNGSGDEGGFGTGTDDADSLRGAYSRSVEMGDTEDAETETGPSSPTTEKAYERGQREVSVPLCPS